MARLRWQSPASCSFYILHQDPFPMKSPCKALLLLLPPIGYWRTLAMVAFTLLPVGWLSFFLSLQETVVERVGYWGLVLAMVGVGLTLPFYGAEAFGLYAIGQEALRQQNADLLGIAAEVRAGTGLILFLIGLLLLAASAVLVAIMVWKSGKYVKWSGIPLAVGIALYIPQFFFAQPIRVAHGILVAIGCVWLAVELWRQGRQ